MKIYFTNTTTNVGGPSTFINNLSKGLKKKGHIIAFGRDKKNISSVIVVSSTRKLFFLILCKLRGIRIIQRLDGMWYQSLSQSGSLGKYIYFRLVNLIMFIIRNFISDIVIYQSKFVKKWWENEYGVLSKKSAVIYNGAKLIKIKNSNNYTHSRNILSIEVICIEANYHNVESFYKLIYETSLRCQKKGINNFHLFGNISKKIKNKLSSNKNIIIHGYKNKKVLHEFRLRRPIHFSLDFNAACPNSVIESMCYGIPVVGLNTGSLKELVSNNAGIIVNYDGNHLKQDIDPDYEKIANAILSISKNYQHYSENAYKKAKTSLTVENMVENYYRHLT